MELFKKKNRLSCELKSEGRQLGMCDEIYDVWNGYETIDDLCRLYADNIEFIINHPEWKLNKTLKRYADLETLHKHGIYIDEKIALSNINGAIINGTSDMTINMDGYSSVEAYVREDSEVHLNLSGHSIGYINLYDNAKIDVHTKDNAKCFVYKYGGGVDAHGDVKVRDRKK